MSFTVWKSNSTYISVVSATIRVTNRAAYKIDIGRDIRCGAEMCIVYDVSVFTSTINVELYSTAKKIYSRGTGYGSLRSVTSAVHTTIRQSPFEYVYIGVVLTLKITGFRCALRKSLCDNGSTIIDFTLITSSIYIAYFCSIL
ncbi:MAG: hypothetical protein BWY95_02389 [Bacteroidetes bacterium ADurb.BinA104]|nr:MAG: hypothetical protein BWY95_02389 [Bacteroidetes bacterium ADurb.BinA104]